MRTLSALVLGAGLCAAFEGGAPRASRAAASRVVRPSARMVTLVAPAALANLDGELPDCPRTTWSTDGIDIEKEQAAYKEAGLPTCPLDVSGTPEQNVQGAAYFAENAAYFRTLLAEHGTLWFKGFDLMKDEAGFHAFYDAVGLSPCLDPIHTSGLRAFASARDGVYQVS
ncbi:hypothetical protein T492DRAFT_878704 [Pavlovales sp. CCMP2436]|nr:hypothetical protein T492DRAFT_878704 [Pavlovales sp. CCMP2436]